MKFTMHICDRCKREFTELCRTGVLKLSLRRLWYHRRDDDTNKYELCKECSDSFFEWLSRPKQSPPTEKGGVE